jgi:hypothetical protein
MTASVSNGFDYSSLDDESECTRVAFMEVGGELIALTPLIEYGEFVVWVERECALKILTAVRAAEAVGKNDKWYLRPDGPLALTPRSAPKSADDEFPEEIEAGAQPTAAEIKQRIAEAKEGAHETAGEDDEERRRAEKQVDDAYHLLAECLTEDQYVELKMRLDRAADQLRAGQEAAASEAFDLIAGWLTEDHYCELMELLDGAEDYFPW